MIKWDTEGGDGSGGSGGGTGGVGGTVDALNIEFGRIMLAVTEGDIKGFVTDDGTKNALKSLYLNDTPVCAADGTFNFNGVSAALVAGTNTQTPIPGFPDVESEVSVSVELIYSAPATPTTRSISTSGISAVRVRIAVPQLKKIDSVTGKETGTSVQIQIERQRTGYNGGAYEIVTPLDQDGTISGKFGSKYTKSFRIELPNVGSGAWSIRVTRLTVNAPDAYTLNETWWESYTELTDAKFRYPNTACLAVMVDAKQFQNMPQISADMDLRIIQVPKNYTPPVQDPSTGVWTGATYATTGPGTTGGIWDGSFKLEFSRSPVWQFYDMAIHTRYGGGTYLSANRMSIYDLYAISQVCDVLVSDGKGGTEPRYFCDIHIQGQEEAIKVLDHFASAFRGMTYWANGKITAVQDVDEDPVAIFTAANVKDGKFTYNGSGRRARHTAAIVSFNDPKAGYRQESTYVESATGIARYGLNLLKLAGFGVTSEGLAKRLGYWSILSDLRSPETVTFTTGAAGAATRAGQVIQIMDPHRAGLTRFGGRVGSGSTTTVVVLDAAVVLPGGTNYLLCQLPNGTVEKKTISTGAGSTSTITVSSAFSAIPQDVWIIQTGATAVKYRVISIKEGGELSYDVLAIYHDVDKYADIETGLLAVDGVGNTVNAFPPISGLALAAVTVVLNDKQVTSVNANWDPPTIATNGANVVEYIAESSRDFLPWEKMVVNAASSEIPNVIPGSYRVRVTAKYTLGISAPVVGTLTVADTAGADDYVNPTRKREIKSEWTRTKTEQVLLDAQATSAGVTTEKTTYDNAITTLYTYLDGLTDTDTTDAWSGSTSTGDWLDYTLTCYLGAGGGVTMRANWTAVYAARDALVTAISTVALAPSTPTDTFRPVLFWDLGDGSDAGFTLSGATTADSASPYAKIARALTSTGVDPQLISPVFNLTGKDCRVIVARIRLNSGTWEGKAMYKGAGVAAFDATNQMKQLTVAPTVGTWIDMAWDMANLTAGGTTYIANTGITQIRLDFCSTNGSVVDVDWVAVGTYGSGSRYDADNAIYLAILGALASGNVTQLGSTVISNGGNLIPNPKSELTATILPAGSYGLVALDSTGIGYSPAGVTGCRKVLQATTSQITGRISCKPGEVFYVSAQAKVDNAAVTAALQVETFDAAGTSQGLVTLPAGYSTASTSYGVIQSQAVMPADSASFAVRLNCTASATHYALFDDLGCLKCADAFLYVNGSIGAIAIAASAIQTYHISVGPNYQFTATASGAPLLINNDGTFSANTVNGAVENSTDAATYMDAGRIYPSAKTKTFEANFSGTQARGFLINLSSAFGSNTVGLQILHSGTTITVKPVTSIRTYGAALTPTTTPSSVTTAGTGKLTAIFSGDSGTTSARRLIIKLDGVEVQTYSDTAIGATNQGQQSGYAGIILGAHATRPGDVKIWGIALGMGSVTLQDGVIAADHLIADFATVNTIRSSNYTAGHADAAHGGSGTGSPVGFKLAGTTFTTTYADSSTDANCQMEIGGSANFGGYKVATVNTRVFQVVNRISNMGFALALTPWGVSAGTGTPVWDSTTKTAGSGSAVITATASSPNTATKTGSIYQAFSIPEPTSGQTVNLTFQMGEKTTANTSANYTGYVLIYILDFSTGTETSLGAGYSFDYNSGSVQTTVVWNLRTIDITTNVANGGDFLLRFEMNADVDVPSGASSTTSTYVDEVSIVG